MAGDACSTTPAAPGHPGAAGVAARPQGGVEVGTTDGVTRVRFWGAVDLAVRVTGTAALRDLRDDAAPMALDCREVTFMDSTGLSVLVRIVRDAAADGRRVSFLGAPHQVQELLRATGVDVWMSGLGVEGVPTEG